jgi:hypothetical protein
MAAYPIAGVDVTDPATYDEDQRRVAPLVASSSSCCASRMPA